MGKMSIITPEQQLILDQIKESEFYLQHRLSEDLDFFSEKEFVYRDILLIVKQWAQKLNFSFKPDPKQMVKMFYLEFKNGEKFKVDFGYYPYKRVEKGLDKDGLTIDSLLDIAINKLSTVNQRSSVKDFVDLYYLLKKFTIWDLMEGVKIKFHQEFEYWILAADLEFAANQFNTLPRMIKPLILDELKNFFREKAKELGRTAVEP